MLSGFILNAFRLYSIAGHRAAPAAPIYRSNRVFPRYFRKSDQTMLLRPLQFTEVIEFFLATSVIRPNHAAPPAPIYRSNQVFPRYFRKSDQTMLPHLLQFTEVIEFFLATSVNPSNHAAPAAPIYRSNRVFPRYFRKSIKPCCSGCSNLPK